MVPARLEGSGKRVRRRWFVTEHYATTKHGELLRGGISFQQCLEEERRLKIEFEGGDIVGYELGYIWKEVKCQRKFPKRIFIFYWTHLGRDSMRGYRKMITVILVLITLYWRQRELKTTCNWELETVIKKHWGPRVWNWKWMLNENL